MVDKCLAFCQVLVSSNQRFNFNLSIDKAIFNFDNKELVDSSCIKKKKSPSQLRRETRRREERKQNVTKKDTADVSEYVYNCNMCETVSKSEQGLKIHIGKVHKDSILKSPEKERSNTFGDEPFLVLTPEKREHEPTSETPGKDVKDVKSQPEEAIMNIKDAENTIKVKPKLKRQCNYSHVNGSKMWCYNDIYTQQEEFKCWCDTNCPKPCILQENKK